jgi:hypothetical protein
LTRLDREVQSRQGKFLCVIWIIIFLLRSYFLHLYCYYLLLSLIFENSHLFIYLLQTISGKWSTARIQRSPFFTRHHIKKFCDT